MSSDDDEEKPGRSARNAAGLGRDARDAAVRHAYAGDDDDDEAASDERDVVARESRRREAASVVVDDIFFFFKFSRALPC